MKYPKLPHELDRRKKISLEDIERMKELRKLNLTYKQIGEAIGTYASNVGYHLNPLTKQKVIERTKRAEIYKFKNDYEFRKRKLKNNASSKRYINKVNPKMKEYKRQFYLKLKSLPQKSN